MSENPFQGPIRISGLCRCSLTAVAAALLCLPLLSGCGGGGDILATVGDREVTAEYYQDRLARLTQAELPVDEDGITMDTTSLASKLAFLNVIINKELMVLKAKELGYDTQEDMINAEQALIGIKAGEYMREDLITVDESEILPEDVDEYYAKRQEKRHFQFIICNFEDDAREARQKIVDGAAWDEVADEYNDGSKGPTNDYTMSIQYGMAEDLFERALFDLEEGQMSMPIETVYGYWIVRFTGTEPARERPLDEEYRLRIRRTLAAQRTKLAENRFFDESMARHEFMMDEAALWIIFQGLPEGEGYLDKATNKPIPKDQLAPLDVPAEDAGRVFFSVRFDLNEEPEVWTIGEYKTLYADMSVFQRPKRAKMLGGIRQQITTDMVTKRLLMSETRERGYHEDPRVVRDVQSKVEEIMVNRFHDEVIKYDDFVSAEALAVFWADHKQDYMTPELRNGQVMNCKDEAAATQAYEALTADTPWEDVYTEHAQVQDPANREPIMVSADTISPERDALFAVGAVGDVTGPFRNRAGWHIIRLDNIIPPAQRELEDIREEVAQRIRLIRKDESLNRNLASWRDEFGVEIFEDALAAMPAWNELQTLQ
ncbi:peptidyl-prolyl cis-trans isomerase [bacterium]|nr:peptidyl-prolyl cis-trans isomerase [bacterium]